MRHKGVCGLKQVKGGMRGRGTWERGIGEPE